MGEKQSHGLCIEFSDPELTLRIRHLGQLALDALGLEEFSILAVDSSDLPPALERLKISTKKPHEAKGEYANMPPIALGEIRVDNSMMQEGWTDEIYDSIASGLCDRNLTVLEVDRTEHGAFIQCKSLMISINFNPTDDTTAIVIDVLPLIKEYPASSQLGPEDTKVYNILQSINHVTTITGLVAVTIFAHATSNGRYIQKPPVIVSRSD